MGDLAHSLLQWLFGVDEVKGMSGHKNEKHKASDKYVTKWESYAVLFVFLTGALLHFVFEWSGESPFVGAIASVNESVWEHFKQGFWPMCLYAGIEYVFLRKRIRNFLPAKAVAVYLIPTVTGLAFYGYSAIVGHEILIVDILIFLVAIILGQAVSYRIMISGKLSNLIIIYSVVLIVLLASVLVAFTFYPPHLPIFLDKNTGLYGIP